MTALEIVRDGRESPTISGVARAADVSRQFFYDEDNRDVYDVVVKELAKIQAAASRTRDDSAAHRDRDSERVALINSVARYKSENARLRAAIRDLETKRDKRLDLGHQLLELDVPTDLERAAAYSTIDRLQAENIARARELQDAKLLIAQLTEDLSMARQALEEELTGRGIGSRGMRVITDND